MPPGGRASGPPILLFVDEKALAKIDLAFVDDLCRTRGWTLTLTYGKSPNDRPTYRPTYRLGVWRPDPDYCSERANGTRPVTCAGVWRATAVAGVWVEQRYSLDYAAKYLFDTLHEQGEV